MELLAGARDDLHLEKLCRQNGLTVRKLVNCLIAAIAIRVDMLLLHLDSDFAALEKHTPLTTV